MAESTGHVIGIDLGTTFCAMAYLDRHGTCVTIPNAEGELTTPSVVLFESDGTAVVGRRALRASQVHPDRVAVCVKRDMGDAFCSRPIAGRQMSPVHVSSVILKKLKQDAEKRIGAIAGAVITVPAYFDEARRQATVDAGTIAGLNVLDILNEPTAAALAYGFHDYLEKGGDLTKLSEAALSAADHKPVVVYDLGGGTFDVTVIRIEGEVCHVLATDGDVRLGGKDWDDRIVAHAAKLFLSQHGSDPRQDPHSHQELVLAAEEAKKDLSARLATEFTVHHAGKRLVVELGREKFEEMTHGLLYRTESRVAQVLDSAGLTCDGVGKALVVGGSTRMPQVSAMLRRVLRQEPDGSLSADEVVAHGAAIQAAMAVVGSQAGKKPPEQAKKPQEPGREADGFIRYQPAAQVQPADESLPQVELHKLLDPTEERFVSLAFDYDENISKALSNVKTVNVNAHSLGLVAQSLRSGREVAAILIPRNSPLPVSREKVFGTVRKNQTQVKVRVLEGESKDPGTCVAIGECVVAPLPKGLPKGSPIRVTFSYDNSGRLHVKARDDTSGLSAQTVIIRQSALSDAELTRARKLVAEVPVS